MSHIQIDFDGLSQQASAINSNSQSYESLISSMQSLASEIGTSWEGGAAVSFQETLQKYLTEANKMKGGLDAVRKYASDTVATFEALDQSCAALIRGAF